METYRYVWLAMAGLGLATGLAIPQGQRSKASAIPRDIPAAKGEGRRMEAAVASVPAYASEPLPVSGDSMEDLLALDAMEMYARLGLWLLDASEEQMAEFWSAYHARGETDMWIKDLVFTQWAKLNPQALLAAAKRDGEEGPAWWAWGMSDPDAALAAVEGASGEMRGYLLRGIGNFHPDRALKMLEADPSLARWFNLDDLGKELGEDDPRLAMEFMNRFPDHSRQAAFKRWVEKDPHEAFRWLKDHPADRDLEQEFCKITARDHPEVLAELAGSWPSGAMKRKLEQAAFALLVSQDPEKALEMARTAEAPKRSAELYAELGKGLVATQPERALELFGELLGKCPDATCHIAWVNHPGGGRSGSGAGIQGVKEFLSELAAWNPRQTMESVMGFEAERGDPAGLRQSENPSIQVAKTWAERNPDEFAAWCEGQDEKTFAMGASTLAARATELKDYEASVGWALRIPDPDVQANALANTVSLWAYRDREAARAWVEEAPLSDKVRSEIRRYIPESPP
jgi:hypothetical protein